MHSRDCFAGQTVVCTKLSDVGSARTIASGFIEQQLVAAMKFDLRNLVTAEEGFFADSVRYTANVGRLQFRLTGGNTAPQVTLTNNGWSATIGNPRTPTVCVIFVGSTPRPPAKLEITPACQ